MAARRGRRGSKNAKPPARSVRVWLTDPSGFGLTLFGVLVAAVFVDVFVAPGAVTPPNVLLVDVPAVIGRDVVASAVALIGLRYVAIVWLARPFARRHPSIMGFTVFFTLLVSFIVFAQLLSGADAPGGDLAALLRTVLWLTAVALVALTAVNAGRQHLRVMAEAKQTSAALKGTLSASENLVQGERARVYERIAQAFRQMVTDTHATQAGSGDLKALADDVLRPLSRSLANDTSTFQPVAPPTMPKLGVGERFAHLLSRPLIQPGLLSAVVFVLTFRQTLNAPHSEPFDVLPDAESSGTGFAVSADWESFFVSLFTLFAVAASVYVSAYMLSRIYASILPSVAVMWRWLLAVGAVVVVAGAALVTVGGVYAAFDDTPPPYSAGVLFGIVLPLGAVMAVSTVLQALFRLLDQNEAAVEAYNSQLRTHVARTNAQLIHERRDIARRVHNSVQAAVNAARLTLDQIAEPDSAVFDQVTGRIADAVEQLLADAPAKGMPAQLDGLEELWSGLCTVSWTLDEAAGAQLDTDAVAASLVGDIIYEACANAVVHGHATRVEIAVVCEQAGAAVRVTVRDNGVLHRPVAPGMGSQILASVCTSWELEREGDETVLTAVMPGS